MTDKAKLFPKDILAAAQHAERETGLLACISLAQWADESGFGKYDMEANNFFGFKWYSGCPYPYVVRRTREWIRGKYVTIEARFIKFPSIDVAFVEHAKLLMNPKGPYGRALGLKDDWEKYIRKIAPIYATEPKYADDLVDLINKYRLFDFNLPKQAPSAVS